MRWRQFLERLRLLFMLLLLLVVLVVVMMVRLLTMATSNPVIYVDDLVLPKPLPTLWNLTCPEAKQAKKKEAAAVDEGPPLSEAVPCVEREARQHYDRRGDFWVLHNYAPALERPRCWEAVTVTTQGDVTFLGSLGALVRRWRRPVSLALYAPGSDLQLAARAIAWARACLEPPLVARHVSFHVVADAAHLPDTVPPPPPPDSSAADGYGAAVSCSEEDAPWLQVSPEDTYRRRHGLLYPVNVVRNVAREEAGTHFVLPLDLELVPSAGLSDAFLAMVRRQPQLAAPPARRVFVLPAFEVGLGVQPPENKSELVELLRSGWAASFHEHLCGHCHKTPQAQQWVCSPPRTDGALGVTAVTKRTTDYERWEPFYIGTHSEPLFDERLSWEGMQDKIMQSYTMCLLDYEFHVLDDAFLVHQPGVRATTSLSWRVSFSDETKRLIGSAILPELTKLYGHRKECIP